jgi:hypothetical protein
MLKVKQSVSFDASTAYVGWSYDSVEFRDNEGNEVSVKVGAAGLDSLIKALVERQARWQKEQSEKFTAKVEE